MYLRVLYQSEKIDRSKWFSLKQTKRVGNNEILTIIGVYTRARKKRPLKTDGDILKGRFVINHGPECLLSDIGA